jgi:hypothetical protein
MAAAREAGTSAGLLSINARYFAIRAVLFGVVLGVVLLLGVRGLLAFALALGVSGLLSFPLAMRQRHAVQRAVEARRNRFR